MTEKDVRKKTLDNMKSMSPEHKKKLYKLIN